MNKEKIFWGWYIVAGSFFVMAINYGARYCFGVFVMPLALEHGWSRSVISMAATINMLVYSMGAIFVGPMLDRIAPPLDYYLRSNNCGNRICFNRFYQYTAELLSYLRFACGIRRGGNGRCCLQLFRREMVH